MEVKVKEVVGMPFEAVPQSECFLLYSGSTIVYQKVLLPDNTYGAVAVQSGTCVTESAVNGALVYPVRAILTVK